MCFGKTRKKKKGEKTSGRKSSEGSKAGGMCQGRGSDAVAHVHGARRPGDILRDGPHPRDELFQDAKAASWEQWAHGTAHGPQGHARSLAVPQEVRVTQQNRGNHLPCSLGSLDDLRPCLFWFHTHLCRTHGKCVSTVNIRLEEIGRHSF